MNWNNLLTTVGTAVATIAAITSGYNTYRINALDTRTKTEDASYRFASLFLDKVMASESLNKHERRIPALLSILDIAAQASSSETGRSSSEARAVLPIHLALLLGEPGTVAELDRDCRHLDTWLALALVDTQDDTRVTAIQAMVPLAQKALLEGRLGALHRCVKGIDQLLGFVRKAEVPAASDSEAAPLATDPKVARVMALQTAALGARADLALFIQRNQDAVGRANLEQGASGDAVAFRDDIIKAFPAAVAKAQDANVKLRAVQANLEPSKKEAKAVSADLQTTLDRVDVVLATAATDAAHKASAAPAGASVPIADESRTADHLKSLIQQLQDGTSTDATRSELSLFGQKALKPLLALAQRDDLAGNPQAIGETKIRLEKLNAELAATLRPMQQPLALDASDVAAVIKLLRSDVRATRTQTAEFLMNLEEPTSIKNVFLELEKIVQQAREPKSGSAVQNAALIVVTWARNLNASILTVDQKQTMRKFALEKAKEWKQFLINTPHEGGWEKTLAMLNELIAKAEAAQKAD